MGFYAPAFCTNGLISILERQTEKSSGGERAEQGLIFCVGLFAAIVIQSNILAQSWMVAMAELPQRMRAQITTSVYATALRRKDVTATSTAAEGDADSSDDAFASKAQVITLTTVDAARISEIPMSLQILLMSPAELLVGGYFSIKLLGTGALLGFASSLMLQPLVLAIGKYIMRRTTQLQKKRDERGAMLGEALSAMRMLKFNAWEDAMSRRILRVRKDELGQQRSVWLATILNQLLFNFTPTLVTLVAYGYFSLGEGRALTPSVAFTASAVLAELRWAFLNIPLGVNQLSQALVSLARVARYLDRAEDDLVPLAPSTTLAGKVGCKDATIAWPRTGGPAVQGSAASSAAFALRSVSLEAVPGALNLVCGKIGAGKTLLLLGLLGECDVLDGEVSCPHTPADAIPLEGSAAKATGAWLCPDRSAYMPQATFLINATVRDNILFGTEWDEVRYADTLNACGLLPDLAILEDGDETEVGESGVGLSGGQKVSAPECAIDAELTSSL
jgi:ABC-type multidrug transport system fused ATPase/permease subunit